MNRMTLLSCVLVFLLSWSGSFAVAQKGAVKKTVQKPAAKNAKSATAKGAARKPADPKAAGKKPVAKKDATKKPVATKKPAGKKTVGKKNVAKKNVAKKNAKPAAGQKPSQAAARDPSQAPDEDTTIPAGHSQHGAIFNEGPRQRAYLMKTTGGVQFAVTSKHPQVQAFVEQGIGQLHGYWNLEAERSFRQAAKLDADCAIAYWGMAMANFSNSKRAKGFINEALERKSKASPREQAYIDAFHKYFHNSNRRKRSANLVAALEALVKKYPKDLEAQAQLGHLLYKNRSTLKRKYDQVDKVLNQILAVNPMHPVHHYRIHLWDYKDPKKALESAAKCGQTSPGIAHMWHMPGHIYSRLQRYQEAVWQQEASARVDHAHMMRDRVMPDQIGNFAHNNEWLIRNLEAIGRHRDAVELAKNMISLPQHPKYNTYARRGSAYYGRLRLTSVLTSYERWQELIHYCQLPVLEPTDRDREQVQRLRALGVAYARSGKLNEAEKIMKQLEARTKKPKGNVAKSGKVKTITRTVTSTVVKDGKTVTITKQVPVVVPADAKKATPAAKSAPKKNAGQPAAKKTEPAKAAVKKSSAVKTGPKKTDTKKPVVKKTDVKKTDAKKTDAKKTDAKKTDAKKADTKKAQKKTTRRPRRSGRRNSSTRAAESAVRAIKGHLAVARKDYKTGYDLLKRAGIDKGYLALIQARKGDKDGAVKAAESHIKSQKNKVLPLAHSIYLLWELGHKDKARKQFERLRAISSSVQFGSPVFDRLTPIAEALKLPSDWRIHKPLPDTKRPPLDKLGPFRWQPSAAEDFLLADAQGKKHGLRDYRGRPVIVIFYLGYGCLHCVEQLHAFAPAYEKFKKAGIEVVAISSDDKKGLATSLKMYKPGMPFPLLTDSKLDIFKSYRAFDDFENLALHGTFLIDAEGLVRWQDISYEPFMDVKFLLKESQRLLAQPGSSASSPIASDLVAPAKRPAEPPQPIVAAGIKGAIVVANGAAPDESLQTFIDLSHREKSSVLVLQFGGDQGDHVSRLFGLWKKAKGRSFQVFRATAKDLAADELSNLVGRATGIWVTGGNADVAKLTRGSTLPNALREFLNKGGVLGTDAAGSALVTRAAIRGSDQSPSLQGVSDLVPDAVFDFSPLTPESTNQLQAWLSRFPHRVGYVIEEGAALVFRGRRFRAMGAQVHVRLADAAEYPAYTQTVSGRRRIEDLTALRRFARQRKLPLFPAKKPAPPRLDKGSLIIVGGGGMPRGLVRRFVELAGEGKAVIAVIPISMPDPLPSNDRMAAALKKAGAKEVHVLRGRTAQDVDKPESLAILKRATGIWFGGGRQWRFIDAYEGTAAAELMHQVLKKDGVIGGSSAGASIQGEYMARGNPLGSRDIMADGYERGLSFLKGVAIDQHFTQRRRQPNMTSLVDRYPQLLGIGIDEATALIVKGNVAEVIGRHRVCFYDRGKKTKKGSPDFEDVKPGGKYDLVGRKILAKGGRK